MTKEEFYATCADVIGTVHDYRDRTPAATGFDRKTASFYRPMTRGGRRSGREPGNGRFPGIGIVQDFGTHCRVALRQPVAVTRIFVSQEETLAFLGSLFSVDTDRSNS